jgi:hypothetical protein
MHYTYHMKVGFSYQQRMINMHSIYNYLPPDRYFAENETISLSLMASVPVPNVPGIEVDGQVTTTWQTSKVSGLCRAASGSEYCFMPMFALRANKPRIFTRRRDGELAMPLVGRDM